MKKRLLQLSVAMAVAFTASAQMESPVEPIDTVVCPVQLPDGGSCEIVLPDSMIVQVTTPDATVVKPAAEPIKHFTWGIDAGSAIDLTGKDMSAIDISACFGYSGPYVRFAGIGAAIDMMVSSSSSSYPVFAMLRTDFRRQHQLCFLEARGGVAFTNINNLATQSTPFGSLGVGITLATGRTFSSHILLSYNYTKLNDVIVEEGSTIRVHDLQYASIKIGISF